MQLFIISKIYGFFYFQTIYKIMLEIIYILLRDRNEIEWRG